MKKLLAAILLTLTTWSTFAQYDFQIINRTPTGGDSLYVWSQKENSNSWYFADFMAGMTNAISDLQLRSGYTNVNYLLLVGRTTTNEYRILTNGILITNLTATVSNLNLSFTNFTATNSGISAATATNIADAAVSSGTSLNVSWSPTVKDPTGFLDTQAGSYICTNITGGSSNWFTWTGSNVVLMNGIQSTLTNVSILVPTNNGTWFIYKPNGSNSFIVTNVAWDLSDLQLATVYSDGTNPPFTIRETHGVMGWQTHRRFHLDPQLGGAWISGFTFATNPPLGATIGSGTFFDEDILHTTPQTTNVWLAWQKVGGTALNYRLGVNLVATNATGGLQYDSAGTLTDVSINNYMNVWIYVIPNADTNKQIVSVVGRSADISLSTIRAETPPSLIPGFASQEAVLLHRATWRNQAGSPRFIESTDYRQSKLSGGSTVSGATGTYNLLSASVVNGIVASASEGANGGSLTNLQGTSVVRPLLTWAGPTNFLYVTNVDYFYTSSTNVALTNIFGYAAAGQISWATLTISNAAASAITSYWNTAGRAWGTATTNALPIGAGKEGMVSIWFNGTTNYMTITQQ